MEGFNYWQEGSEGLIFKVNDLILAFPILDVFEIKTDNKITRLPGYPIEVLGASLIRQELVTILSVNKILNVPEKDSTIDIIAKVGDGRKFGFRVNEILGNETISKDKIKETGTFSKYCVGFANINNTLISLTTPETLFKMLRANYGE